MHFYKTMHEHNTIDLDLDLDLEQRQTRQKDFETHDAICAEILLPMFYIDVRAILCRFDVRPLDVVVLNLNLFIMS